MTNIQLNKMTTTIPLT